MVNPPRAALGVISTVLSIPHVKSTTLNMGRTSYSLSSFLREAQPSCHTSTGMLMTDRRGISRRDQHTQGKWCYRGDDAA
ncbi:hypothetical protein BDV37DRAFT_244572 [Aspergillus pseudonomiae]|uniref:Uncharacterized protein n=1 Tax=Aspergillus pseudonomiae TaxID=1506151 RepID=A0A5N7DH27_9EURO|nr:uncharacterized protein BDV37DRAFT_244572 [Aspergillus pseudonomiae]KAE8405736.1 hypothetical protein BDV37DRAFT_244572 [Aspergillus pseudonomiae]